MQVAQLHVVVDCRKNIMNAFRALASCGMQIGRSTRFRKRCICRYQAQVCRCSCFSECVESFACWPYPEGDSITPYTHSFHTVGRVWGAVCTGIPNAPRLTRLLGSKPSGKVLWAPCMVTLASRIRTLWELDACCGQGRPWKLDELEM